MNIFYIHTDPRMCAEWAVDSHCVKMILEASQMLSTAHRVIDGHEYIDTSGKRKVRRWRINDQRDNVLYSATHVNHPSAAWARTSDNNYWWLYHYLYNHCKEYTYRYGKVHKVEQSGLLNELAILPEHIKCAPFAPPPNCMDTKYIISKDVVENYRNYYKVGKAHLHKWKKREAPPWIIKP